MDGTHSQGEKDGQALLALVTETFPPEINGVAMTLGQIVTGIRARGLRVQVYRPRPLGSRGQHAPAGEKWLWGFPIPGYQSLRFGFPSCFYFLREWKQNRPQRVHIATEGPLGLSALTAARLLKIPVTSSFHTNFHAYSNYYGVGLLRRLTLRYMRWFHNRASLTFVPTPELLHELEQKGFRSMSPLGRGVNTTLFSPDQRDPELRQQWNQAGEHHPVLLYVGRIAAEKNIPLAIQCWQELRRTVPDLRMVLVGDGPLLGELKNRHPDLIFAGMRKGEDLARHYASADILLFPSTTETFGNVVTEGMASGLSVVAYQYAAAALYIRHQVNGYLAEPGQELAFLHSAALALQEFPRHNEVGKAARQTALTLSWDKIVDLFLDFPRNPDPSATAHPTD